MGPVWDARLTVPARAGLFTGCLRSLMPQSHHTHEPRMAVQCFFFKQKSYVHSRGPYVTRAAPYEFCLPVRVPYSFNACRTGLEVVNSPWTAHAGTVRGHTGPVRPHTTPVRDFCKFWLCQFPYVSVRVLHGPCTGPVRYEKHWRFPIGDARTAPVRALHGVHVESCELFDQTINVDQCQAVWGP